MSIIEAALREGQYRENTELENIIFSPEVYPKAIPKACFMDCGNLIEIRCPDSVRRVASGAFEGCKSLERFILTQYSQLTVVEEGAFKGCCISNFTIPKYFSVEESDLTGILSLGENYSEKYCVQECFIMSRNKISCFVLLESMTSSLFHLQLESFNLSLTIICSATRKL